MNKKPVVFGKWQYAVAIAFIVLFALVSFFSLRSIHRLQGNARVVNYVGIVRGATQKLVKRELQGYPDDALIARLDSIVDELITGDGPNGLTVLDDPAYLGNMNQVRVHWEGIKEDIEKERAGLENDLFEASEEYFVLVDRTVSSAEVYSEQMVHTTTSILIAINVSVGILLTICIVYFIHTATLQKRADALGKIAFIDPLTQIPNRASCERHMAALRMVSPQPLAVFMFDMNNLKYINDESGHARGDQMIVAFARILKEETEPYGFIGRYGGDEFVSFLVGCTEPVALQYLSAINEKVVAYNLLHVYRLEKISFAVGYTIGSTEDKTPEELLDIADRKMYEHKRKMKENMEQGDDIK